MKYTVKVSEQAPTGESILCFVRITCGNNGEVRYNTPYFVCDLEKNITQCPTWLGKSKDYIRQVKKLGYKLEASFQKSLSSDE